MENHGKAKEYRSFATRDEKGSKTVLANRYKLIKKLGSGSFGTVYLVADLKHEGEMKVLKQIHVGDMQPDDTVGAMNEARLLSKLVHPGIVKFYDSFTNDQYLYIVTEYCEGGDLDMKLNSWKKNNKQINKELIIKWFIQLLLAVQYMHQRRVLHRDLKSRNIFLKNGMVKIGDFGISRILIGTSDVATTFTGTPYFMSPELLRQEGYNSKSDIWSIGVILYEMCTLEKPFKGDNLMSVMFSIVEGGVPALPQQFGQELQSIYCRMLCKDPAWRVSASELIKHDFIQEYLLKLKVDLTNNIGADKSLVQKEAREIAKVFQKTKQSATKAKESQRPATPKERLQQRKQKLADEKAERLKQITARSYAENREKYSYLKERQKKISVPCITNSKDNTSLVAETSLLPGRKNSETSDIDGDSQLQTEWLHSLEISDDDKYNKNIASKDVRQYTHCFGEDDEETFLANNQQFLNVDNNKRPRDYTHCFGDDSLSSNTLQNDIQKTKQKTFDNDEEDVFYEADDDDPGENSYSLTVVSNIPEDALAAETYYSNYEDFEEVSSDDDDDDDDDDVTAETGEYEDLMNCMEKALLSDSLDCNDSSFDSSLLPSSSTTMRQQRIESLRRECIRLLGDQGFQRVYGYLDKVRFTSRSTKSEAEIMGHLKKYILYLSICDVPQEKGTI